MTTSDIVIVIVVPILFVGSIFLALSETAFTRSSRIRARSMEEEGVKNAGKLAKLLERPERTLNVVLLLVLVSQLTSATLIGVLLENRGGVWGIIIGIVVQIVAFFVIGEVAPKTFAVQHSDRAALFVTPMLWALTSFYPLRMLSNGLIGLANVVLPGKGIKQGPFVTEDEIRTMADVAAEDDAIESEERRLIHSIFEFGDTIVREVMMPRTDMVAVEADSTVDDAINTAIEAGYSRLPAYEDTTDHIVGLVYLKDLVREARENDGSARPVRSVLRPAVFVPEGKRVSELLQEMRTERFHLAVVMDEYEGTAGIVTMEDLIEEIVGEITDEYDVEEPTIEELPDGTLRAPGRTPIDDIADRFGREFPDLEWDTVGGLVFNTLGHVPKEGETVEFEGLRFRAERVTGNRIVSVLIEVTEAPESAAPRVADGSAPASP
ncbi:MAG: hypothetical protein JWL73_2953 [Actinomycetia bacterium]|nr:hypothetical protein [Actinomycetes bacterium]